MVLCMQSPSMCTKGCLCGSGLCLHTQTCVWINTRQRCMPCPFLEGRHVRGHTHILCTPAAPFLLMHLQKAKWASLSVTKTFQFIVKGVYGANVRMCLFQIGCFPSFLPGLPHALSGKPCFNLKNKIKISSRTDQLRVSQEKVCKTQNLKGRRTGPRGRREKSGKRTISLFEFPQKKTTFIVLITHQFIISLHEKRRGALCPQS